MYYLLENNRIIKLDNAKFSEYGLLKVYEETGKVTTLKLDGTIERYTGYFVKKQSENVYDLIENGDLLKYKDRFDGIVCLDIVKEVDTKLKTIQLTTNLIKYHEVISFYKPNSKGDYIKVWEKGE